MKFIKRIEILLLAGLLLLSGCASMDLNEDLDKPNNEVRDDSDANAAADTELEEEGENDEEDSLFGNVFSADNLDEESEEGDTSKKQQAHKKKSRKKTVAKQQAKEPSQEQLKEPLQPLPQVQVEKESLATKPAEKKQPETVKAQPVNSPQPSLMETEGEYAIAHKESDKEPAKTITPAVVKEQTPQPKDAEKKPAVAAVAPTATVAPANTPEAKKSTGFFSRLFGGDGDEEETPDVVEHEDKKPQQATSTVATTKKVDEEETLSAEEASPDDADDDDEEIPLVTNAEDRESLRERMKEQKKSKEESTGKDAEEDRSPGFFQSLFGSAKDKNADGESNAEESTTTLVAPIYPYLSDKRKINPAAQAVYNEALQAMKNGKTGQALSLFEDLAEKYPDYSGPQVNLGIIYRNKGIYDEAAKMFSKAVEVNKNNLEAYNQLAYVYRQQGKFKEAEQVYADALVIWPNYAAIHYNMGILYDVYLGKLDNALSHFETFQTLQAAEDKKVAGWIADLKRRIAKQGAAS